MQMTNDEIVRRYEKAENRRKMIRILAELNACPKEDIRKILREAGCDVPACGNRYTAAKKAAEVTEADGSERKQVRLTESGERLLKNEEQKKVGTHQQDVGEKSETRVLKTEHSAPTACQPARPVDVWAEAVFYEAPESIVEMAKEELRTTENNIEDEKDRLQAATFRLEILEARKAFLQEWLRRHGGAEG